jgi:hypothetical protein
MSSPDLLPESTRSKSSCPSSTPPNASKLFHKVLMSVHSLSSAKTRELRKSCFPSILQILKTLHSDVCSAASRSQNGSAKSSCSGCARDLVGSWMFGIPMFEFTSHQLHGFCQPKRAPSPISCPVSSCFPKVPIQGIHVLRGFFRRSKNPRGSLVFPPSTPSALRISTSFAKYVLSSLLRFPKLSSCHTCSLASSLLKQHTHTTHMFRVFSAFGRDSHVDVVVIQSTSCPSS